MGTEITAGGGKPDGKAEQQPNTNRPAAAGTGTAGTTAPRTGTDSGTGTGTTAGTETGKSGEKTAELAILTDEQKKAEARRQQKAESARRAEARKKAIANGEPIPEWAQVRSSGTAAKKATPKKQEQQQQLDASSIQQLIKTVFDLVATRPNCAHWRLSDAEAMELAKPIADILADYAAVSDTLAQNSKYIALVMAAFAIAAPRVIMSTQIRKAKREAQHGIIAKPKAETRAESKPDKAGKAGTGSAGSNDAAAANGAEHMPSLYELVPAI